MSSHLSAAPKGDAVIRKSGAVLLAFFAGVLAMPTNAHSQTMLTHHMRETVRNGHAQAIGRLPANQVMTLNIVLPLRNQAELDRLLSDIYDLNSPSYHHYLTVPEFTAQFGPSEADYDAVVRYAKANGFTVIGGSRDGMNVEIKGPVSAVQAAFHVNMHTYQHPTERRVFYAPDREPTVSLPFNLWHISGLDNYSLPHPLLVKKSDYAKAHGISQSGGSCHDRIRSLCFVPG